MALPSWLQETVAKGSMWGDGPLCFCPPPPPIPCSQGTETGPVWVRVSFVYTHKTKDSPTSQEFEILCFLTSVQFYVVLFSTLYWFKGIKITWKELFSLKTCHILLPNMVNAIKICCYRLSVCHLPQHQLIGAHLSRHSPSSPTLAKWGTHQQDGGSDKDTHCREGKMRTWCYSTGQKALDRERLFSVLGLKNSFIEEVAFEVGPERWVNSGGKNNWCQGEKTLLWNIDTCMESHWR